MTVSNNKIVRVGVIGCGEISQVSHIPTLGYMSDFFQITYLCDISQEALNHCKNKVAGAIPKTTRDPAEICSSPEVDVLLITSSSEYHAAHAILALQHDKFAFVEKPMCLSLKDADAIIAAEKLSKGTVMVGYQRRYAAAFLDAVEEIGGMGKIVYARVRGKSSSEFQEAMSSSQTDQTVDIIGPNSGFVKQSGTFPKAFTDFTKEDVADRNLQSATQTHQGLETENGVLVSPETAGMWNLLCGLGSHDLSAMREALGMPISVLGASMGFPFWK
jgi:hypothetical protein